MKNPLGRMKSHNTVIFLAILGIIAISAGIRAGDFYYHILFKSLTFAILGIAWTLMGGQTGLVSFGHALFFGVGAYTSVVFFVHFGITPLIGMIVGAIIAAGLGAGVVWACHRMRITGIFFAVSMLALSMGFKQTAIGFHDFLGGKLGLNIKFAQAAINLQFKSVLPYLVILALIWIVSIIIVHRIRNSSFGTKLSAIRMDETAAASSGVKILQNKVYITVLSAALAAIVGTVHAFYSLHAYPEIHFGVGTSLLIVIVSMFGGSFSLLGPTVGAFILIPFLEFLKKVIGMEYIPLAWVLYGGLLVIVIMFLRKGVMGYLDKPLAEW